MLSLVDEANIGKILFLRHGNTAPSSTTDFDRILTDDGRSQTKQSALTFGVDLNPFYPSVLVSPSPRTVETARIFLHNSNATADIVPIDVLYDGTMQPEGPRLFKQIGYAPLEAYLENDNDEMRMISQRLLGKYALSCVEAMKDAISDPAQSIPDQSRSTLMIVGHAVYLPAAALGVASLIECCPSAERVILNTNTREAEGYLIDIEGRTVRYLSRDG
jgi:broad specificity phosphatase PhoE